LKIAFFFDQDTKYHTGTFTQTLFSFGCLTLNCNNFILLSHAFYLTKKNYSKTNDQQQKGIDAGCKTYINGSNYFIKTKDPHEAEGFDA
jgi:hypothetical protein